MKFEIKNYTAKLKGYCFDNTIDQYIEGTLPKGHVFKLGNTPTVMRMIGIDDLPIELASSVLERKEAKHNLNIKDLKTLPTELEDPIAVFKSNQVGNGIVVLTEIPSSDGDPIIVAIHLNKKKGKGEINSIRSIHQRTKYNIQSMINRGELAYLNTQKKPKWLRLPFPVASGRSQKTIKAYGREVFTENDLSQEKNIEKSPKSQFSYADDNSSIQS